MKANIWTENYRPFIIGGDVNAPIMCNIDVLGPYDLGKGFQGWLFATPSGKTLVAETQTGAIVGSTLEEVKNDIESASDTDLKENIEHAKRRVARAYMASEEEFWKRLK